MDYESSTDQLCGGSSPLLQSSQRDGGSEGKTGLPGTNRALSGGHLAGALLILLVLSFLPRFLLACQTSVVCDDGYYYLWTASLWEQGKLEPALRYLNINTYPLILAALHQTGLEWLTAAQVWGVGITTFTVIPLFLLIRGLFNDAVALVACVLFASHPELVEISVEPVREPTFWFFFVMSLYAIHRTTQRERLSWGWSFLSGLCVALAVHTRTEGWALVVPLVCWPLFSAAENVNRRERLLHIGLMVAVTPALLLVVNLTLLKHHSRWEWGRFEPAKRFADWLRGEKPLLQRQVAEPVAVNQGSPPVSSQQKEERNTGATFSRKRSFIKIYLQKAGQSLEYLNLCLLAAGMMVLRGRVFRRDLLPLTLIFAGLMLAVWVYLSAVGKMNGRYFLTAYYVVVPTAAVGALKLGMALRQLVLQRTGRPQLAVAVPLLLVGGLTTIWWHKALTKTHVSRQREVALGLWIRDQYGPFRIVETDKPSVRVGYSIYGALPNVDYYEVGYRDSYTPPDILVVRRPVNQYFRKRVEKLKLHPLPANQIPAAEEYSFFVSEECLSRLEKVSPSKTPYRLSAHQKERADHPARR